MTESIEIRRGSSADIPELAPLWISVHHRHIEAMPELAPYVTDGESWAARKALYTELLAKPNTVLVLACVEKTVVGYGLAYVMPARGTWIEDTWKTGPDVGEIESLAVLPAYRGRGIGTRLLAALEDALNAAGVQDLIVGALAGNAAAIRLYQSRGFRPTWTYLSRFAG